MSGTSGGTVPGPTLSAGCTGNFPTAPQHTLTVGAAIPMLRVMANAGGVNDTSLAVRRPDGTYVCNDDWTAYREPGNRLNPVVEIADAPPGEYQVFVGGVPVEGRWPRYNLILNEEMGISPDAWQSPWPELAGD